MSKILDAVIRTTHPPPSEIHEHTVAVQWRDKHGQFRNTHIFQSGSSEPPGTTLDDGDNGWVGVATTYLKNYTNNGVLVRVYVTEMDSEFDAGNY